MAPQPVNEETEIVISVYEETITSLSAAYGRLENENADLRRERRALETSNRALSIDSARNRRFANCSMILAAAMAATAIAGWAAFLLKGLR